MVFSLALRLCYGLLVASSCITGVYNKITIDTGAALCRPFGAEEILKLAFSCMYVMYKGCFALLWMCVHMVLVLFFFRRPASQKITSFDVMNGVLLQQAWKIGEAGFPPTHDSAINSLLFFVHKMHLLR